MIVLNMKPKDPVMSWSEFCEKIGPYSIAIDGYVAAGPRFDANGPRANFNHHEEVDRLATRATCAQGLIAIRQGLFDCFSDDSGRLQATVYANDCDEDVCTSWFLLCNPVLSASTVNPILNRLVSVEELMDATAGAYPIPPNSQILQELAWIFEPYRRFRVSGEIDKREEDAFRGIVTDVGERIMQYIVGRGRSIPLDVSYNVIGGGPGWTMVQETGTNARTGMFANGIRAYVAVRERPNNRYSYTVGRMSQFIPFDVPRILQILDAAKGNTDEHWGGGNTIGGSSRANGSKFTPQEVQSLINNFLK